MTLPTVSWGKGSYLQSFRVSLFPIWIFVIMLNNAVVFEAVQGYAIVPPKSSSSVRSRSSPPSSVSLQQQPPHKRGRFQPLLTSSRLVLTAKRGFGGQPEKKIKSSGQLKREKESSKYDEIAATGGQEYNVYVRQFGSDDKSWLPCGAIAVPRAAQVSDAIYANVDALKSSIVRTYPRLRGFEEEFEFGYNLKIYPDDAIEVATKRSTPKPTGLSVGNWLSTLFSPVDASKVPPPPMND